MNIQCTSRFHKDLSDITKKVKDRYFNCLPDILIVFGNYSIEEIAKIGDSLNQEILPGNALYRKIRIPNSLLSGKSGGFRLFCICFVKDDTVILLHIYPKTGRLEGINPQPKDYIRFIDEMISEKGGYYNLNKVTLLFEK